MSAQLSMPAGMVSAATAKAMLADGNEIAFLDIREHGQYGEGHPFFVVNCPFSRLEIDIATLVPNRRCRILLLDDGDGVAENATACLHAAGYTGISILEGGAPAWEDAGYVLFKGVNVPSKAFGELVEESLGTPSVAAEDLKAMIDRGENIVVLDGRSPGEYNRMNIPTARSCPNGELAYRIAEIAPDPQTKVVINCAGRTRSIIGTQTLLNLGIPNPVVALRNGSQGWQLAGFDLEYGSDPGQLPDPGKPARESEAMRRARFIAENDIATIGLDELGAWRADTGRTTYLLDIRTIEEYRAGHLPGAVHAPGGQLVQATDHWVGVRGARIVVTDNQSLRAATTCNWLLLMGYDAVVLDCDVTRQSALETGAGPARQAGFPRVETIPAKAGGRVVIDVSPSADYQDAHIADAHWGIRPRLSKFDADKGKPISVTARDARIAHLAADQLRRRGHADVAVIEGGLEAWRAAGLEIVATPGTPAESERIDFLFFVHDRHDGGLESARLYLQWESELLGQMDAHERSTFSRLDDRAGEVGR